MSRKSKKAKKIIETKQIERTTNNAELDNNSLMVSHPPFPFWARLKIDKNRTTLVIDEEEFVYNKQKHRFEPGFVHREATHANNDLSNIKGCELIKPNPDKKDNRPMYLKKARKHPKILFNLHNKKLKIPKNLKDRYSKNNKT